jgi:hypothetical protein
VRTGRETAGPSAPLRYGRDDNSVGLLTAIRLTAFGAFSVQQNCHPDRSEAERRDLLFLSRFSRSLKAQLLPRPADPRSKSNGDPRSFYRFLSCDLARGRDFALLDRRTTGAVPAPDFKSGEAGFQTRENTPVSKLGALALVAGRPCTRARLYRLRKNSCFVSGHDFSRAVKSHSYEGFSP